MNSAGLRDLVALSLEKFRKGHRGQMFCAHHATLLGWSTRMNGSKRFVPGGIYKVWTSMGMRTWNVVSVGDDGWIEVADQNERCFLNAAQIIQYIKMD